MAGVVVHADVISLSMRVVQPIPLVPRRRDPGFGLRLPPGLAELDLQRQHLVTVRIQQVHPLAAAGDWKVRWFGGGLEVVLKGSVPASAAARTTLRTFPRLVEAREGLREGAEMGGTRKITRASHTRPHLQFRIAT